MPVLFLFCFVSFFLNYFVLCVCVEYLGLALRVSVLFASAWIGKHGLALLGRAFHCFAFFLNFFFISFAFHVVCISCIFCAR